MTRLARLKLLLIPPFLVVCVLLGVAVPLAQAAPVWTTETTTGWIGLRHPGRISAISAYVRLDGHGAVYVSLGGGGFLSLVQVGILDRGQGKTLFAAWGRGEPGVPGSAYTERYFGPGKGTHLVSVTRSGAEYLIRIDGRLRLRVADPGWPILRASAMGESWSDRMPGFRLSHVRAGRLYAMSYLSVGTAAWSRMRWGADWMTVDG